MLTKVHLVKVMVFPVVMCRCESWTIKKAECWRIGAFELWCWRKLVRIENPWTEERSNQSIQKAISFSSGSSQPRDGTQVSRIVDRCFTIWATREVQSKRQSALHIHWKDWCWSWSSNILATGCEDPTHWKRPWCWERLTAGGEGGGRGWDGWMASLTQWTWVWINSRR